MQRQELVASLNFSKANPRIPLDELRLWVVTKHERWPAGSGSLSVGVSSFGMGGSNCHVIVCPPSRSPEARRPAARCLQKSRTGSRPLIENDRQER
ncbi:ketoacyl-synthetase C-terminal extension domain-containing protein [Mycobacterium riyadhense]|uniref:ketoacyl-synthetase C-terminal extension domain-containing protein n=1 Tax=Mycobacterium riyadhense TaxID=486698 RepID=UPI001951E786